jgi:hypothetical protein
VEWPISSVRHCILFKYASHTAIGRNLPSYRMRRLSWSSERSVFAMWKIEPLANSLSLRQLSRPSLD